MSGIEVIRGRLTTLLSERMPLGPRAFGLGGLENAFIGLLMQQKGGDPKANGELESAIDIVRQILIDAYTLTPKDITDLKGKGASELVGVIEREARHAIGKVDLDFGRPRD